jgi:MoaA/NifB/PqqE/SkfB family radical SAM enzyme
MNLLLPIKISKAVLRKVDSLAGSMMFDLKQTLSAMALRPFELNLELTNICNANCVFCCYQFQKTAHGVMSDAVFYKAVHDFASIAGGSVGLTPMVGDPLVDPNFLDRIRYMRSLPQIDRIFLTTNGILLDKFGIKEILTSGITSIDISTSGFDEVSYKRIFRSSAYKRMKTNVLQLLDENAKLGHQVNISIGLRTDRPINLVMKDPDFQPILRHKPHVDFTYFFGTAGGRITPELLFPNMRLRRTREKHEACANLYNGPIVLPDGDVFACACYDAMDAVTDLKIGNILEESLSGIYSGLLMSQLREQFSSGNCLNRTCANCDSFQGLDLYRTKEGRVRARLNLLRKSGQVVHREDKVKGISSGG